MWTALAAEPGIGLSIVTATCRVLWANDQVATMVRPGWTGADLVGKSWPEYMPAEWCDEWMPEVARAAHMDKVLIKRGVWPVAGCDEAGRGCLAGPVYAAAVILPPDFQHPLLNDSKQLTEKLRDELRAAAALGRELGLNAVAETALADADFGPMADKASEKVVAKIKAEWLDGDLSSGIDGAETHLQRAVRLRPANADAQNGLGSLRARQGRFAEAIVSFEAATRLQPNNAKAHFNLGLALLQHGEWERARATFSTVLELEPNLTAAKHGLAMAIERLK